MQKWIILIVLAIIVVISTIVVLNVDIETEYTPETEIEETELRKTIVTLYFKNKENGELAKESRLIDSKELLLDPYIKVINMLITGPENESFEAILPSNVKVIDTQLEENCLIINFSEELLDVISDEKNKELIEQSVLESLNQFTEINTIKILVNGNEIL